MWNEGRQNMPLLCVYRVWYCLIRLELLLFCRVCQLVPVTFASRHSSVDADCLAGKRFKLRTYSS